MSDEAMTTDDKAAITKVQPTKPENEVFVDGVMSAGLRAGVAKIDFFQAIGPLDDDKELRAVSQRLVMPVQAVFELHNLLGQMMEQIKARNAEAATE